MSESAHEHTFTSLVLGTRNAKKLREMAGLIAPAWEPKTRAARLAIKSLLDFNEAEAPEVVEDAADFAGNARKKASETARALGAWVLADDSGLAVDALGGAPGVLSARYAGRHGDDDANNRKLIADLRDVADADRGAAYVCVLALADPAGAIRIETEGRCRGRIAREPRGSNGFGYDPYFLIPEYHQTYGELSPLVKARLSHRARAFEHLRIPLERLLTCSE